MGAVTRTETRTTTTTWTVTAVGPLTADEVLDLLAKSRCWCVPNVPRDPAPDHDWNTETGRILWCRNNEIDAEQIGTYRATKTYTSRWE